MYVPLEDKATQDILQYFERCFSFISRSRARTNILVHCKVGVSRSATIVIGYLMSSFGYSLKQSFDLMVKANPRVSSS